MLLILNLALFGYCFIKLLRSLEKNSNGKKNNRTSLILILLCIAVASRCTYQAYLLFSILNSEKYTSPLFKILDNLPTLIFITVSSLVSHLWYRVYSKLNQQVDDEDEDQEIIVKRFGFKHWLVVGNICLYAIAIVLTILSIYQSEGGIAGISPMHILFFFATFVMMVVVGITGSRFHSRTVKWLSEMGNTVKSTSGFTTMFRGLILCYFITCLRQVFIFYCRIVYNRSAGEQIALAPYNFFNILHISYIGIVFVVGESLPFLLIFRLMDSKAKKVNKQRQQQKTRLLF